MSSRGRNHSVKGPPKGKKAEPKVKTTKIAKGLKKKLPKTQTRRVSTRSNSSETARKAKLKAKLEESVSKDEESVSSWAESQGLKDLVMDIPPPEVENGLFDCSPPTEVENGIIHSDSDGRRNSAVEAKSDVSSECALSSNAEYYVISDSEINCMDNQIEFSLPPSNFSSGDNGDNVISSPFIVNSPTSKSKLDKIISDNSAHITCIYKDPELQTAIDASASAVIIDQPTLLAALEIFLSKKEERRKEEEEKSPSLSEINPSDLNLSSVSDSTLFDLAFFSPPKALEGAIGSNSKSIDFSALCGDMDYTQGLTEECLPPLFSDRPPLPPLFSPLSHNLGPTATHAECSTSEGVSDPVTVPVTGKTGAKRKRRCLFGSRKRKAKKLVVPQQNDQDEPSCENTDICNYSQDSKLIQIVSEGIKNCSIVLTKAQDHETTVPDSILDSDLALSDSALENENSDKASVVAPFEAAATSYERDVDTSDNAKLDRNAMAEEIRNNEESLLIVSYEDILDYEPDIDTQSEKELEVDKNLEFSKETKESKNPHENTHESVLNDNSIVCNGLNIEDCPVAVGEQTQSEDEDSDTDHSFKRRHKSSTKNKEVTEQTKLVNGFHSIEKGNEELQAEDIVDSFSSVSSTNLSIEQSYDSPAEDYFTSHFPNFFRDHSQEEPPLSSPSTLSSTSLSKKVPAIVKPRDDKHVLNLIKKHCERGELRTVIDIAKEYISISDEETQKKIFTELFWHMIDYITHRNCKLNGEMSTDTMSSILKIFYDYNLQDPEMCSMVVSRCFDEILFISHAIEMFEFCEERRILLTERPIAAYANYLISKEPQHFHSLLAFFEYLKTEDKTEFSLPKQLLSNAVTLFIEANSKCQSLSDFKRLCDLMCGLNVWEVDPFDVQKFVEYCIGNDCWVEVAKCFRAWSKKNPFSQALSQAFMFKADCAGTNYAKFAAAVYEGVENLPLNLSHLFGQMGVMLMLETHSVDEPRAALEIFYTLYKHHINIFDLQEPLSHRNSLVSHFHDTPKTAEAFVFSFTVAFVAVDVLLNFSRPKDALEVLQGFSKSIPEIWIPPLKSKFMPQLFRYLLKLTQLLHFGDPFNKGLEAFHSLLSSPDLELPEVKILIESKRQDLEDIFNQYVVSLVNTEKVQLALDLYKRCTRTFHGSLNLRISVFRGLITATAQMGLAEVKELFLHGCRRNIYQIEKPILSLSPWRLRVGTSWTAAELKLVIEHYLETLSQMLTTIANRMESKDWFPIGISFKPDQRDSCREINCLVESSLQAAIKRAGDMLTLIDSNLKWNVNEPGNMLEIDAKSFYNFWKAKFPDSSTVADTSTGFHVESKVRVSFGQKSPEKKSAVAPKPPKTPAKAHEMEKIMITKNLGELNQNCDRSIRLEVYNNEEFEKIFSFLKSKVKLKCKNLTEPQQGDKAKSLAKTFIESNGSLLDRKTMKLLSQFAEESIDS